MPLLHHVSFWLGSLFSVLTSRWDRKGFSTQIVNPKTKFKIRNGAADKFIIWEVWRLGEYEAPNQHDIVVDIGAQIGTFTVFAAQRASRGVVLAYEPFPENFALLEQNVKLNALKNVTLFQLAVSSTTGQGQLFIQKHNSGGHSVYNSGHDQKIEITKTTLEQIITHNKLKRVDYLKIDTEGSEYDIVLNTPKNILNKVSKIVIEYHDYYHHGHNYHDIEAYLKASGFNVETGGYYLQQQIFKSGFIKATK